LARTRTEFRGKVIVKTHLAALREIETHDVCARSKHAFA